MTAVGLRSASAGASASAAASRDAPATVRRRRPARRWRPCVRQRRRARRAPATARAQPTSGCADRRLQRVDQIALMLHRAVVAEQALRGRAASAPSVGGALRAAPPASPARAGRRFVRAPAPHRPAADRRACDGGDGVERRTRPRSRRAPRSPRCGRSPGRASTSAISARCTCGSSPSAASARDERRADELGLLGLQRRQQRRRQSRVGVLLEPACRRPRAARSLRSPSSSRISVRRAADR